MFKKIVNLSCFLSAVLAEGEVTTTEGAYTELATAKDGNVKHTGVMGESFFELDGDQALILYVQFTTQDKKSSFKNGSWIQSYAQFEDPKKPGTYAAVTCNVGYDSGNSKASGSGVSVGSFYGDSIAVADMGEAKWDSIGTPFSSEFPAELLWQEADDQFAA